MLVSWVPKRQGPRGVAIAPRTYADLKKLTDEELMAAHDRLSAAEIGASVEYYLRELARRDVSQQTATIRRLTWVITFFTAVNVVLTAVAVWIAVSA